ncbi:MAG: TAXI family TRAP transporter solute-binding subunit [Rhodospirillales bacterium]|nr:MAG: TAXI family TRAP transporter solute-binding subunit [Rhodospirillales bacterium]
MCGIGLLLAASASSTVAATDIVIGTGSVFGVYFQVGRGICRLVERHTEGLECSAVPTPGSRFNMDSVQLNAFEVGIVQSDVHYKAYNKTGDFLEFADVSYDNIRSVFSVHGEPFTVLARRDSGIRTLADLAGRRVNLGNPGSGQRATMQVVMDAMGWTPKSFAFAGSLPAAQQSLALCHGQIEAMVYVVGHPNKSIQKATDLCDALLVRVEGPEIDLLVAENPYYSYMTIPGGIYRGNGKPVNTFGVRATVVVSADLDADTVYAMTRAVFEHLDQFKKMYPAFDALDPKRMISEGLAAPLHAGAIRYYVERGLM